MREFEHPIVVKVGTNVLIERASTGFELDFNSFTNIGSSISELTNQGNKVAIVTSAAITAGLGKMGWPERPSLDKMPELQMLATIGNPIIIGEWDRAITEHAVGQILLTRDVVERDSEKNEAKTTIYESFRNSVIPVINENDAISHEEIEYGDNDILALMLAKLIGAKDLVLLTDVDGIYQDPENPDSIISELTKKSDFDELQRMSSNPQSDNSKGGMKSKIEVTKEALNSGISTYIANGREPNVIQKVLARDIGTVGLAD